MKNDYIIHTDGGARGNPGPAALGAIIEGPDIGKKSYGEYIGKTTNNVAEYSAVVFALKKLKALIGSDKAGQAAVRVHTDSELLVKQVNGEYKVKEESIQKLFLEVWNLRLDFGQVNFYHIMREKNHEADRMVNHALDHQQEEIPGMAKAHS